METLMDIVTNLHTNGLERRNILKRLYEIEKLENQDVAQKINIK